MSSLFQTYSRWPIDIKKAKGTIAEDENGKTYLDFIQGIAVSNLGHCHDAVTEAVKEQLDSVWHVSNLFENDLQEKAAAKLAGHSEGDLVFFCNSGAEANEGAIKLARKATGKTKIVTFHQSFHGRTYAGMAATGQDKIKTGFGPMLQGFHYLPFNDPSAFSTLSKEDDIAAVMLETVQGEGGVNPADPEFIEALQTFCKDKQALLIADEIQTGIGRTGKAFGYEHFGISPDIITAAKGLGNGFPVGAVIGKKKLGDAFTPGTHGTTFGGNKLAMAAVKATLDIVFQPDFLQAAADKGSFLKAQLNRELTGPFVKEIRGKGLLIGIECAGPVSGIIGDLQERGLLVLPAGPNVIRLLPPLTVSEEEMLSAVSMLKAAIEAHSAVKR
ncbi:acetylornithine transaminase [Bacillus velezensis]|uniref:acetylornithine transaminase n=1 Tax=Bacillus TaxID=1386 RepID=UPI0003A9066E|nr:MULTISPECIES: acetylornithine transaminase [Bacillus]AQS43475.1 aspartate aminotransferase family protein [Bacillus velezensis]ATU26247.1 acetylornithine transaminase [Bacillus velezensis]AUS16757.1 acetylornithine transaminase [Bacillus velezensis]KAF1277779.1 acetylornithine transaminase [Bacillus amyloliquefaciens]KAF6603695.1 acetylornithine transaminase [Bacillus sp. EKM420B]